MKIILAKNKESILIDDEDFERISKYKWHISSNYAVSVKKENGKWKAFKMHRFIMNCPKGLQIDHIDNNTLNNQKSNLRICTDEQNAKNRKKQYNETGFKGVRIWGQNFHARIAVNHRYIHIGSFPDAISAAKAYDKAAREHHGEFARTNFDENGERNI